MEVKKRVLGFELVHRYDRDDGLIVNPENPLLSALPNLAVRIARAILGPPRVNFSGQLERLGDDTVLYCDELPLAGIGSNSLAATRSFLDSLTAYVDAAQEEEWLDAMSPRGRVRVPGRLDTFSLTMTYGEILAMGRAGKSH